MNDDYCLSTDDPRHGTARGYRLGCRCTPCAVAKSLERGTPHPPGFAAVPADTGNNATRRAVTTTDSAMTRDEYYRRTAAPPRVVVTRHNSIGQLLAGDFR